MTAISPTPAGEGKTTTSIGLGDALARIGKRTMICLREPSMGPVFGMKGGATGGGYSQVVPMEDINLHFTGDFAAIALAHNLLSALLDNHIHHGNALGLDVRRITWPRVVDVNDRALRDVTVGLGGPANGFPRQDRFDIVVASEVMAILCLATNFADLKQRLGDIVVGYTGAQQPVTARDLRADGAMAALLRDAVKPNLVQTLEGTPALIHGGPFANIAHGCSSVIATSAGMKLADYVVTEAGFGADLGAEKFIDIKCRVVGPAAALRRGRRDHPRAQVSRRRLAAVPESRGPGVAAGGVAQPAQARPQPDARVRVALRGGAQPPYPRHRRRGRPAAGRNWRRSTRRWWWRGIGRRAAPAPSTWRRRWSRPPRMSRPKRRQEPNRCACSTRTICRSWTRSATVARRIYGAVQVMADKKARTRIEQLEAAGYGHLPVCIAKTQSSFSNDPTLRGAPEGHVLTVREVRLAAGARFVVMVCGDILTMPGLPAVPAAEAISVTDDGRITGLS